MKKLLRKEPNAGPLSIVFIVALLIFIMAILSIFIKKENHSTSNIITGNVISHATLTDNINKKIIYVQGKQKISPNYIKTVDVLCDVKNYNDYPIGKQLNNFNCKFDKHNFNKQIISTK